MHGYIVPDKPELKIREHELYSAYYCGLCKSIGKRYGQLPRMTLSYDSVFLALMLGGIKPDLEDVRIELCPVHPLKRRPILYNNEAVDYAADMHLVLSFYKLKDDFKDDHNYLAGAAALLSSRKFHRLEKLYPDKCEGIAQNLNHLSAIEKQGTASLDESAEPFARIMESVFLWDGGSRPDDYAASGKILARIGYHIGKWIYITDAFDDLEKNIKDKAYNPILIQFEFGHDQSETIEDFRLRVRDRIAFNLLSYLEELSKAYDLLPIKKNRALIENIIYLGLLKKTEEVLAKGSKRNNGESI